MIVNLNDVLKKAQKEHYAVGLFNTTDSDMLEAVISAAEELRSPVVIGTAQVLLPYGELPEGEKEYDRNTAMETLKLIVALGYRIEKA